VDDVTERADVGARALRVGQREEAANWVGTMCVVVTRVARR